jgi:hypothetical protein
MRSGLALVFVLAACGGGGTTPPGGDDVQPPDGSDLPPGARGFTITSIDVSIAPGQEITRCFFFRTPNTELFAMKRWSSEMTAGSHHMIMFLTGDTDVGTPGTVSDQDCGGVGNVGPSGGAPSWTYAAQTPTAELALPADDGTGKPLAQEIPPNTAGFIQMHYLNATDAAVNAHVKLVGEAYDTGTVYTKTAPFVTYDGNITIGANEVGHVETTSCSTPPGVKFWLMSTHAHKQAVHTEVRDGTTVMVSSEDWEHPTVAEFNASPFFTFASGTLTWSCTYDNTGDNSTHSIKAGPSAATDEMCMASGYYFPGDQSRFCFNSIPL